MQFAAILRSADAGRRLALGGRASKVHPLGPLPQLGTNHPHRDGHKNDGPLPRDTRVQEHNVIEAGDVDGRKDNDEDNGDGEEEEAVAPEVGGPGADAVGHVEEGAARVDELPGEEEKDPGHGGVRGGAGAEDVVADGRVGVVALVAELAAVEAKDDDGEGAEDAAGHEDSVDDHVEHEFGGEDAVFELQ